MKLAFVIFTITLSHLCAGASPTSYLTEHEAFFDAIKQHCGKAFQGSVKIDTSGSERFKQAKLVMHVRECSDNQLSIPFHVGDDASRTWVLSKTDSGIILKHDHRHKDGSLDKLTMYGGITADKGWPQAQSFPADAYTRDMFVEQGIPQSVGNTWQMFIYPNKFTYRLVRQGFEFKVEFDLSQEVSKPQTPWGFE